MLLLKCAHSTQKPYLEYSVEIEYAHKLPKISIQIHIQKYICIKYPYPLADLPAYFRPRMLP